MAVQGAPARAARAGRGRGRAGAGERRGAADDHPWRVSGDAHRSCEFSLRHPDAHGQVFVELLSSVLRSEGAGCIVRDACPESLRYPHPQLRRRRTCLRWRVPAGQTAVSAGPSVEGWRGAREAPRSCCRSRRPRACSASAPPRCGPGPPPAACPTCARPAATAASSSTSSCAGWPSAAGRRRRPGPALRELVPTRVEPMPALARGARATPADAVVDAFEEELAQTRGAGAGRALGRRAAPACSGRSSRWPPRSTPATSATCYREAEWEGFRHGASGQPGDAVVTEALAVRRAVDRVLAPRLRRPPAGPARAGARARPDGRARGRRLRRRRALPAAVGRRREEGREVTPTGGRSRGAPRGPGCRCPPRPRRWA